MNAPEILTNRLRLRAYKQSDFKHYSGLMTSDRARYVDGPVTLGTAWNLFAAGAGRWALVGYGAWAIERRSDSASIGVIGLNHPIEPHHERELGWLLWSGFEGHGYATEAAQAARSFAFASLGWSELVSYIDKDNHPSIRLAERLGGQYDNEASLMMDDRTLVYRYSA